MLIPGQIVSLFTFPGVIVHELAHQLFCRLSKIAVFEVCYFRFGNPAGYVIHETPKAISKQIAISIGPFFLNTIVGSLIALPAVIPVMTFSDNSNWLNYVLIWLGVSIAMHSFPSMQDAKSIWTLIRDRQTPILHKIFATPLVGLLYICSMGSVVWLDLAYGAAVVALLPKLLIKLVA